MNKYISEIKDTLREILIEDYDLIPEEAYIAVMESDVFDRYINIDPYLFLHESIEELVKYAYMLYLRDYKKEGWLKCNDDGCKENSGGFCTTMRSYNTTKCEIIKKIMEKENE